MSPYRNGSKTPEPDHGPAGRDEDAAIVWVWLGLGIILVMTDVGEPGPWGAWSSLGLLVCSLATVALGKHYLSICRDRTED